MSGQTALRPASLGYGRVLVRLLCQIRCYEAKGKGLANMPWDTELSNEQRSAASHVGRHARLLAGPGTGKTRCLTKRIVYLIEEQGVDPSRILVLTFTRAAAAEIRQRVLAELGNEAQLPHISTLSSFALRTILFHGAGVRLPQPIRIADDYEERWIIEEELKRLQRAVDEVRQTLNSISLGNYQSVRDFTEALANQVIPEAGERAEVMGVLERLFSLGDFQSLSSLLRSLSTSLDDVEQETESGAINIMTMHQAKGLTASAVFVVAAEDVYIPGKTVGSRIEDERRLLYVSLTRAKTYLFITHCRNRVGAQTHTGRNSGNPRRLLTRFLQGGPIRSIDGTGFMLETNQR